jgi:hypothetical protein
VNSTNEYMCYDETNNITYESDVDYSNSYDIICYYTITTLEVLSSGYWYELCFEMEDAYIYCDGEAACMSEHFIYYA